MIAAMILLRMVILRSRCSIKNLTQDASEILFILELDLDFILTPERLDLYVRIERLAKNARCLFKRLRCDGTRRFLRISD